MAGEQDRVGSEARSAIEMGTPVLVSAVVIWEVAIKRRLGKLEAPDDLLHQLQRAEVDLLPITADHADRVASLPMRHRDPFDRLLVAQAQSEELPLLSADGDLAEYGIQVVW